MNDNKKFNDVLYAVSDRTRLVLDRLSATVKSNVNEIRIRQGLPLALTIGTETVFVRENGQTQFFLSPDLFKSDKTDLDECFKRLCNNSVFAHESEISNGYVVMKNGCRAGICGNITEKGSFKDISSVNIRIAREVFGCANEIVHTYLGGGLLIVGPPGSGKTTILRDLIRQLSNGNSGRLRRVAVVDSRLEISGSNLGVSANDLGANTDVLVTEQKARGIEIAVRTMFPDIVAFDEIGTVAELKSVSDSFCAGVDIITTAHAKNIDEIKKRNITHLLLKSGAIGQVALLPQIHGGKLRIYSTKEIFQDVVV